MDKPLSRQRYVQWSGFPSPHGGLLLICHVSVCTSVTASVCIDSPFPILFSQLPSGQLDTCFVDGLSLDMRAKRVGGRAGGRAWI